MPTMFDDIPDTLQGLLLYKAYAEKQIKKNLTENKRLSKMLDECVIRIDKKCKSLQGEENERNEQTRNT